MTASDAATDDEYGSAVAVSGSALAVGARTDDMNGMRDTGSVYVYKRSGGWSEEARFFGEAAGDRFGVAVSLSSDSSGDQLLIGALLHGVGSPEPGAAYLFSRPNGTSPWAPETLSFHDGPVTGRFGQAVSTDGKHLLVGAYLAAGGASAAVCGRNPVPMLTVVKTDNRTTASPGAPLTYNITVTNNGAQAVSGVQVMDTFSPKLRDTSWCVSGGQPDCAHRQTGNIDKTISLPPQGSVTFTATATVRLNARGTIMNRACAQAPGGDPACGDDPPDQIQIPTCTADLEITKTAPVSAKPGDTITYLLTVTNHGPCAATGIRLEDPIPAGLQVPLGPRLAAVDCSLAAGKIVCDLPDLASGGSTTVSLGLTLLETCAPSIVNKATVSANETDPNPGNNTSPPASTAVVRTADLVISKTASTSAKRGDPISYLLKVTNLGPDLACGVAVHDRIPTGLDSPIFPDGGCSLIGDEVRCPIGEMPAGAVANFPVVFIVPATAACGTRIVNQATVSAVPPAADPRHANDSGTVWTTILDSVSITKTDGLTMAAPGATLTYTIDVGNPGECPVTVSDFFPAALTMANWCRDSIGDSPCNPSLAGPLQAALTDSTATYRVRGTVSPTFTGTLSNTARVTGPSGPAEATDSTEIAPPGLLPPVPTLSGSALAALALLLALLALRRLRRRSL